MREMPPRGFYHAAEVGRLAGVSGNTIGQWNRWNYISASQGAGAYPHVYSFQDIGEAIMVHILVKENIPRSEIREAVGVLHSEYGYNWPLTNADLVVADFGDPTAKSLIVKEANEFYDVTKHRYRWQAVLSPQNVARVAIQLNRGGWAAREIPELRHIEVDPDRMSGRPVIRGTRVLAEHAAIMALQREHKDLRDGYGLAEVQIQDAVRWYERIIEYEAA